MSASDAESSMLSLGSITAVTGAQKPKKDATLLGGKRLDRHLLNSLFQRTSLCPMWV